MSRRVCLSGIFAATALSLAACSAPSVAGRADAGEGAGGAGALPTASGSALELPTTVPSQLGLPIVAPESFPGVTAWVSAPCTVSVVFQNTELGFAFNSAVVGAVGEANLERVIEDLERSNPGRRITHVAIVGHASSEGLAAYNMILSELRADNSAVIVRALLPGVEVDPSGVGVAGSAPPSAPESVRALDRRVDVTFTLDGCAARPSAPAPSPGS